MKKKMVSLIEIMLNIYTEKLTGFSEIDTCQFFKCCGYTGEKRHFSHAHHNWLIFYFRGG